MNIHRFDGCLLGKVVKFPWRFVSLLEGMLYIASLQVPAGTKSTACLDKPIRIWEFRTSGLAKPKSDCPSNSRDTSVIILDSSGPRLILPTFCEMPCLGRSLKYGHLRRPPYLPYSNLGWGPWFRRSNSSWDPLPSHKGSLSKLRVPSTWRNVWRHMATKLDNNLSFAYIYGSKYGIFASIYRVSGGQPRKFTYQMMTQSWPFLRMVTFWRVKTWPSFWVITSSHLEEAGTSFFKMLTCWTFNIKHVKTHLIWWKNFFWTIKHILKSLKKTKPTFELLSIKYIHRYVHHALSTKQKTIFQLTILLWLLKWPHNCCRHASFRNLLEHQVSIQLDGKDWCGNPIITTI